MGILLTVLAQAQAGPQNPITWISGAVDRFGESHLTTFVSLGNNLYTAFALILIVWTGIQVALSSHFQPNQFAKLVLLLAFGKALIVYYAGGDFSVVHLVRDQAAYLSAHIDQRAGDKLAERVVLALQSIRTVAPTPWNLAEAFWYFAALITYGALQVVAVFVIAFGEVAVAVCMLLGPIFVPFFIVPKMDWLFWGWFRSFLQFAFYRVVASAVLLILADSMDNLIGFLPATGQAMTGVELLPSIMFCAVAILMLLKVPMLTSSLFSGSAGSDGGMVGMMQSVAQSAFQKGAGAIGV
jgi:hypothetical protein